MPTLPNKINDRPMFIAPLQMGKLQIGQFPPPKPAAKQDRKNRPISSALDRVRRRSLPESAGLFSRQPVAQPDAQFSNAFDAPNAGRQLRAQQACIGGFVSEPSHGRQPSVDRTGRELAILEENAIAGDHNLVERQARLRAVPLNEFIDRMSISALRLGRTKAIQDRRFAVVQISVPFSISSFWASPILMPLKPTSSSHRVPVEEVSEALHQRMGSDLRSTRDLEGRSSAMERPHLRHRPQYARRSQGRREPYHQSQAVPAAALPLSKK